MLKDKQFSAFQEIELVSMHRNVATEMKFQSSSGTEYAGFEV
jgi:hypothetical protein